MRTDRVNGFLLDHGFQVLITGYQEPKNTLDYEALALHPFYPGALVRSGTKFYSIADPFRRPLDAIRSICSPIVSLKDAIRMVKLRSDLTSINADISEAKNNQPTRTFLEQRGFSEKILSQFLQPFFGSVMLDLELITPAKIFASIFKPMALGDISLPWEGIQAIPEQIAACLPGKSIKTHSRVVEINDKHISLETGETIEAGAIVVATEGSAAAELLASRPHSGSRSMETYYFEANEPPVTTSALILNGDRKGPIDHVSIPNLVCPSYAPPKTFLISASSIRGGRTRQDAGFPAVLGQLERWFGLQVHNWRFIAKYAIPHALPNPKSTTHPEPNEAEDGIFVCGDHVDHGSLQSAMTSARRAARQVIEYLNTRG